MIYLGPTPAPSMTTFSPTHDRGAFSKKGKLSLKVWEAYIEPYFCPLSSQVELLKFSFQKDIKSPPLFCLCYVKRSWAKTMSLYVIFPSVGTWFTVHNIIRTESNCSPREWIKFMGVLSGAPTLYYGSLELGICWPAHAQKVVRVSSIINQPSIQAGSGETLSNSKTSYVKPYQYE